ncbi:hypothetical protein AAG906_030869 [Vitis piasezkii]
MEMELLMGEVFETMLAQEAVRTKEVEVENLKEKLKSTISLDSEWQERRFQSKKKVSCSQVRSIEMATTVTDTTMNTAISIVGSHHAKHALESYMCQKNLPGLRPRNRSGTTKSQTVMANYLLLPLSSPISPSIVDVHDVVFFTLKLERSVIRRGFRSPSAKASFDHIPNSSKRKSPRWINGKLKNVPSIFMALHLHKWTCS